MKNLIFALVATLVILGLTAQNNISQSHSAIEVGDVLQIGQYDAPTYKHINFPRANFIIKRGGVASYRSVEGKKVIVTSIKELKNGVYEVKIKRADGGRFFGSHPVVSANLNDALESGELQRI